MPLSDKEIDNRPKMNTGGKGWGYTPEYISWFTSLKDQARAYNKLSEDVKPFLKTHRVDVKEKGPEYKKYLELLNEVIGGIDGK